MKRRPKFKFLEIRRGNDCGAIQKDLDVADIAEVDTDANIIESDGDVPDNDEKCQATEATQDNSDLIPMAFDKTPDLKKGYVTTMREGAYRACMLGKQGFTKAKYMYEIIRSNHPMRLYYDAEFYTKENPTKVEQKEKIKEALHYYIIRHLQMLYLSQSYQTITTC